METSKGEYKRHRKEKIINKKSQGQISRLKEQGC